MVVFIGVIAIICILYFACVVISLAMYKANPNMLKQSLENNMLETVKGIETETIDITHVEVDRKKPQSLIAAPKKQLIAVVSDKDYIMRDLQPVFNLHAARFEFNRIKRVKDIGKAQYIAYLDFTSANSSDEAFMAATELSCMNVPEIKVDDIKNL